MLNTSPHPGQKEGVQFLQYWNVIIIIKLRYSVSFSSTCTTKILHLTSSCIAANLINLIRPTSILECGKSCGKFPNFKHIPTMKELNVFPLDEMSITSSQDRYENMYRYIDHRLTALYSTCCICTRCRQKTAS